MGQTAFTGRARRRQTSARVFYADLAARILIMIGGMGTIVAVVTVFVVLGLVILPLFQGSSIEETAQISHQEPWTVRPAQMRMDEYQIMGWVLLQDGRLEVFRADTGKRLSTRALFPPGAMTCWSAQPDRNEVAFGFADGSIRVGTIAFETKFIDADKVAPEVREQLSGARIVAYEEGMLERTGDGSYRKQVLKVDLGPPVSGGNKSAIVKIDQSITPVGPILAALTADNRLLIKTITNRKNLMTGKVTTLLEGGDTVIPQHGAKGVPDHLLLSGVGDSIYLVWNDGHLIRYDAHDISKPTWMEQVSIVSDAGAHITTAGFLIGKTSLVFGDDRGNVDVWFRVKPETKANTTDGTELVRAHRLPAGEQAVTAMVSSARSRMLGVGFADGMVRLYHVTSRQMLTQGRMKGNQPVATLVIAPKDDGLLATDDKQYTHWNIHAPHPETTLAAIFTPVWYEGYAQPMHTWQSSSAEDAFEPKYGMMPLIFGTMKATFYSMLIGLPLALLAAIYTSEFLHPRVKARFKPTIELMASLPSVVLGFLAALIIAPVVEQIVPQSLCMLVTIPFALILGAYLWQLIPPTRRIHLQHLEQPAGTHVQGWQRFFHQAIAFVGGLRLLLMLVAIVAGFALAWLIGPLAQSVFFAGDIKAWLDGQIGSGVGAWMFLLLPTSALLVAVVINRTITVRLRHAARDWSSSKLALLELLKFLAGTVITIALAWALSGFLTMLGWDPRGDIVGTYVQRNALIVGVVMGFAIIPIIYTISDDALSSVPEHLRAASLAAGATPWQTAVRIIVPTAASGLFSAAMIGLGRAVGETMVVLMAAGNTPVMDMNMFSGFRTLSANIAVELPEAVKSSTHFRMLFLAGFVLFLMTFVLNTLAEIVRQRFRKRAFQL